MTTWSNLLEALNLCYPNGAHGCPPSGLELPLCLYVVQQRSGLSEKESEDALYDG